MKNNFKFLVAAFAIVALSVTTASAAYTHSTTLKLGSRSTQVMALQQTLNTTDCKVAASGAGSKGMETTYFGPATKAAVQCFQRVNALGADGVVGPMTGMKISSIVVTDSTLPAGCSSKTGYSTTTGIKCDTTTGTGTTTPTPGNLQGGAGNLNLDDTSTDVEDSVEEGKTEKVVGIEAEAEDSDIAITNLKVTIESTTGAGSTRIEKYFDEVSVWLGDKKVGSADADEFNKDGTSYSKSISLSGAVISEDDEENLFIAVTALSSVDEETQAFDVVVSNIRYTDATGAILSDTGTYTNEVGFDEEGQEDELSIKSSSANPEASTLKIDEDAKSDDMLVLAFDLEADEDSADIEVLSMPINFQLTGSSATFGSVISEVYAKVGSKEYDADRVSGTSSTSGTYLVDFDDAFTIDAGDEEEVRIYVVFQKQDGNYALGSTIKATVDSDLIEAEGDDELTTSQLNGTASGKVHTLNTATATVSNIAWEVPATGSYISFLFTVEAEDDDVTVDLASILANDLITGNATVTNPTALTKVSGDATTADAGATYTVEDGDEARFEVRYAVTGANGTYANVTITSVEGTKVSSSLERSPTAVRNVE